MPRGDNTDEQPAGDDSLLSRLATGSSTSQEDALEVIRDKYESSMTGLFVAKFSGQIDISECHECFQLALQELWKNRYSLKESWKDRHEGNAIHSHLIRYITWRVLTLLKTKQTLPDPTILIGTFAEPENTQPIGPPSQRTSRLRALIVEIVDSLQTAGYSTVLKLDAIYEQAVPDKSIALDCKRPVEQLPTIRQRARAAFLKALRARYEKDEELRDLLKDIHITNLETLSGWFFKTDGDEEPIG